MKKNKILFGIVVVVFCVLSFQTQAQTIGKLNQVHWAGTSAAVYHPTPTVADMNSHLGTPNVESTTGHYDEYVGEGDDGIVGYVDAYTHVQPYGFNGYNDVTNYGDVHAGGFFRDELYFETYNGLAGSLEFDFNIHFTSGVNEENPNAVASFSMNLMGYTGDDFIINDPNDLPFDFANLDAFQHTNEGSYFEFDDVVTLSTNANGDLLMSGSYIPLSFTLWTDTNDGYVDWYNTVTLDGVRVYDENGNLLDTTQYTLLSENNDYFDFPNQMPPSAVPLPPAVLLLGSGLAGLAGLRRRLKN